MNCLYFRWILSDLELVFQDAPQLLAHLVVGVYLLDRSTLVYNLLSSKRTLCESPSAVCPPLLHSLDLLFELFLLGLYALRSHVYVVVMIFFTMIKKAVADGCTVLIIEDNTVGSMRKREAR